MRPDRRNLLETHQMQLTQNLDLDTVVPFLQAARAIPDSVVENVNKYSGLKARLELLKSIKIRGDDAFNSLYEALVFSKQDNLASLLRPLVAENNENIESFCLLPTNKKSSISWIEEEPMELTGRLNLSVDGTDGPSTKEQLELWQKNSDNIYPNFSSPKGHCLIINNHKFSSMPHRKGTEVDCANATSLFRNLGYKVIIHSDLTAKEMSNVVSLFAQKKEHGSSLIVVILTHGEHQVLIGSDGEVVYINNILSKFNSKNAPHLAGKPKIFLFQACRGDSYDNGVFLKNEREEADSGTMMTDAFKFLSSFVKSKTSQPRDLHLPNECDFFIGYATTPGYVSWRNSLHGSWFIQAVCEVFNRHAKEFHICEMMTLVNRRISHGNVTSNKNKQMPEYSNRLRKKFYFFPGISQP